MTINISTKTWAALSWVALAAMPKDRLLSMVKLDYAPAQDSTPARLTAHATDRFRVHRVIVDIPAEENDDSEPAWSVLVPATTIREAARHPSVGKAKVTLIPLTVTDERIESGYEGWVAALPVELGKYPPVARLIGEPSDVKQGPIILDAKYLADLAKWNLSGDSTWTFTWSESANHVKPGPVMARRSDYGMSAVALIMPNINLR